jgi:hypothetical protein
VEIGSNEESKWDCQIFENVLVFEEDFDLLLTEEDTFIDPSMLMESYVNQNGP